MASNKQTKYSLVSEVVREIRHIPFLPCLRDHCRRRDRKNARASGSEDYKEDVFSRYNKAVTHMNSQQLKQCEQSMAKIELDEMTAWWGWGMKSNPQLRAQLLQRESQLSLSVWTIVCPTSSIGKPHHQDYLHNTNWTSWVFFKKNNE